MLKRCSAQSGKSYRPYGLSDLRCGGRTASGDWSVRAIFLGGKSHGSVALATRVFLEGNHILEQERAREKKRQNLRNFKGRSFREKPRKEKKRKFVKINVKLREIELETKHLFTTVSFQVSLLLSFFNNELICLTASHICLN